ncbi:hypothetical protein M9C83_02795 [SAR86 cluster bacterium]|nr:hypothetical protein M9C83_02795 [SAR86 cluster bacterium]
MKHLTTLLLTLLVSGSLWADGAKTLDLVLQEVANEYSKLLPIRLDAVMTVTKVYAGLNKSLVYEYELKVKSDITKKGIEKLRNISFEREKNNYCSNPELKIYRENNIALEHYFTDTSRRFLFNIIIDKTLCD